MTKTKLKTETKTKTNYNIGPGELATAGTKGGPNFVLSEQEWYSIQQYTRDALALPTTEDEFSRSLGDGAPQDLSDLTQLIAAYGQVHQHAASWDGDTYPKTISLASRVYQYGAHTAPIYYGALNEEVQKLVVNPSDDAAKEAVTSLLNSLAQSANAYATEAKAVQGAVHQFYLDTVADQVALTGPDGKGGLYKYYQDKYGSTSAEVTALNEQIEQENELLAKYNKEYAYDCLVAETTPTYVWVWPLGTVAAGIVAGVYGDKAVKALRNAQATQKKIDELNAELAADANLIEYLNFANSTTQRISVDIEGALPAIGKLAGAWQAMADDLNAICGIIEQDIRQALPILMSLGIDEAILAWADVATIADAYRRNAYINEAGAPQASMTAWRLRTLVTSRQRMPRVAA